jgi:hypothetical protein
MRVRVCIALLILLVETAGCREAKPNAHATGPGRIVFANDRDGH